MTAQAQIADLAALTERFWAKVDKTETCWLWTGEVNSNGYGRLNLYEPRNSRRIGRALAHRFILVLMGAELNDGDLVLHSCDTPRCVNPAHLRIGTQTENMRDASAKGRINMAGLAMGARLARTNGAYECRCGDRFTTRGALLSHETRSRKCPYRITRDAS